ncbi:MAG: EAL domain-containing protein [Gammaproteobacteria bacterium]
MNHANPSFNLNSIAAQQLKKALSLIGEAVISTDALGRILYLNLCAERMLGYSNDEAFQKPFAALFKTPFDPLETKQGLGRILNKQGESILIEYQMAPIVSIEDTNLGHVFVLREHMSDSGHLKPVICKKTNIFRDPATGLMNRKEFNKQLKIAFSSSKSKRIEHGLLFIDLDKFKVINNACGSSIGDKFLKEISNLIKSCIRTHDIFSRLGGDEFAVILENCSLEPALKISNAICKKIDAFRFESKKHKFHCSASIGLIPINRYWEFEEEILQAAEQACHIAKESGRNRVHIFKNFQTENLTLKKDIQIITRIEDALDNDGFILYAQKIYPIQHEENKPPLHCEILIRLKQNAQGEEFISPGLFIPIAEKFHISNRIDKWVLRNTLNLLKRNLNSNLKYIDTIDNISINLSGQSISDKQFQEYAEDLMLNSDFDLSKICFEITETASISKIDEAREFMNKMKKNKIKFSLDDFGSGVSSFGYLRSLPVDYIKIDGQFVKNLQQDPVSSIAVKCLSELGRTLNKKTIAEFVETNSCKDLLAEFGVDYAQGYLMHQPEPLEAILKRHLED